MRNAFLALLILSLAPLAAAAPVAGCVADAVCSYEGETGSGDCSEYDSGSTTVVVAGAVVVTGFYDCYPGGGTSSIVVATPAAGVTWGEFHYDDPKHGEFRGCFIFVGSLYQALPCEVGTPPNPGWGNVLP